MTQLVSEIEVDCPCCGSVLVVDFNLRRVVSHQEPERDDKPILEAVSYTHLTLPTILLV